MRVLPFALFFGFLSLTNSAFGQSSCGTAYESGQEARASGDLRRAQEEFGVCAQAECPDFVVQDCTKWLVEVAEAIPKITIKVLDESGVDIIGPRITLDGEPFRETGAVDLNPGKHEVVVEVEGRVTMTKRVHLSAGERHRVITIRPEKLSELDTSADAEQEVSPQPPAGFYIASTVAVVGLGTFAALAISGLQRETSLRESDCEQEPNGCDVSGLRTQYLLADVSLGVGVVSAGVATFLFLTKNKKRRENPAAWNVEVGPTRGGAAASLLGTF